MPLRTHRRIPRSQPACYCAALLLAIALPATFSRAQPQPAAPAASRPTLPDDYQKAVTWFAALQYPDLAKTPFVRIETGLPLFSVDGTPKNEQKFGFLLDDRPDSFDVLSCLLEPTTYRKK